jgi:hypothetical protein
MVQLFEWGIPSDAANGSAAPVDSVEVPDHGGKSTSHAWLEVAPRAALATASQSVDGWRQVGEHPIGVGSLEG